MKIGIPLSGCDFGDSGISHYLIQLLKAIAGLPGEEEYLLYGTRAALEVFDPRSPRFSRQALPERFDGPGPNLAWSSTKLRAFTQEHRLDLLFYPASNRRAPISPGLPAVGTVHDLSIMRADEGRSLAERAFDHGILPRLLRRLDRIISVSEATKKDLEEVGGVDPRRIVIIPHGVDLSRFSPVAALASAPRVSKKFGLHQRYFLYLSRIEHPSKNHVRLIRAFGEFKRRSGSSRLLVLAGKDWHGSEAVHREAEASPFRKDIVFTGFVADDDVAGLYGGADALFFPSLLEGFGMPILEAMAVGLPVFCSDSSSLPEAGGKAARYFDPNAEASIAAALAEATDGSLLATLREAGLARASSAGWAAAASATLSTFRSTAPGSPIVGDPR